MNAPLVKICGLRTQADLDAAAGNGSPGAVAADLCGFIFHLASPRFIAPETAADLDSRGLRRVGVFVTRDAALILESARIARLDAIQLHGDQNRELALELRARLPQRCGGDVGLIRVFWPARYPDREALEAALALHAPESELFLLDAGLSGGGSGRPLPWKALAGLKSPRPWLLAGGLTPANAPRALALAFQQGRGPAGADLNSGLERAPGRKDPELIRKALKVLKKEPPTWGRQS